MFNKRVLLGAVRQMESPRTFLRDTFFTNRNTNPTQSVEIDLVKGDRQVAPFVHPVIGGKVVPNKGYKTNTYKPPLVAPEKILKASDLNFRSAGENPYESKSPEERAAEKTAEYLSQMEDSISRREEVMCAQAIFEGKISVIGEGINEEIDFGFENNITVTTKWNVAGSDPLADIEAGYAEVQEKGFINPSICIMAQDVVKNFLDNDKVQKMLDVRNFELASIKPQQLPNGATYIGRIAKLNLDIYSYNGMYTDDWTNPDTPTTKSFVPSGKLALLPSDANYRLEYAAIEVVDEDTDSVNLAEGERIPDMYTLRKPARKVMNISSRPLPIPDKVDSWAIITVL